ncbi:MAG: nucleotidyltransferase family protein [Thermus sp.]|uniref:nucleotidyltransferase family protein n=1 Tax=Thermus sp. TaxID=275 RepID=UPI003D1385BA
MKTLGEIRRILAQYKPELRGRFGVRELAIFGSHARGETTPLSEDLGVGDPRICRIAWKLMGPSQGALR